MLGSQSPKKLIEFYTKILGKPQWAEDTWASWQVGATSLGIGEHSKVKGKTKEKDRIILNFETKQVKREFARIKKLGAKVVKEPYEMMGGLIATFADPDGNLFQLMSPFEMEK